MADDTQDKVQDSASTEDMADKQAEEQAKAEETQAPAKEEKLEEAQTEELGKPAEAPEIEEKTENKETPQKENRQVSANLEKIIESIEKLSVLELADLVKALEEKFGVSAAAPVAVAGTPTAAAAPAEAAEEKTTFNVVLSSAGPNKIGVIKAVREIVPTLGLKEAKDLVEAAPKAVLESVNKETAEEAKAKLTAAGATVELQ